MTTHKACTIADMTDPRIHRIVALWQDKCNGRAMPARDDIDVVDLSFCLGFVCLIEVLREPSLRFRFRVDGSSLAGLTGFDLTGKHADDIPESDYRNYVIELYGLVVEEKRPVFRRSDESWDLTGMKVESASLPLSADGQTVDHILELIIPVEQWIE